MFDDWKKAWQQAVDNFRAEVATENNDDAPALPHIAAMRRDVQKAVQALGKLEQEIAATRSEAASETDASEKNRRREDLARNIGDTETTQLAATWAERHAQRALILIRKADALDAELAMRREELDEMQKHVASAAASIGAAPTSQAPPPSAIDPKQRHKEDVEFKRLDREARERAAEAMLEEMKKRMG